MKAKLALMASNDDDSIIELKAVKRISAYSSAYEVVNNMTTKAEYDAIPSELMDFIRGCDDYECFCYFVINDAEVTIADSINGDCFCTYPDLRSFITALDAERIDRGY